MQSCSSPGSIIGTTDYKVRNVSKQHSSSVLIVSSEARQSTAIAVQLAQQLRLPEKSQAARSDHDIDRLTWASILQLHNTASNNRA